MRTVRVFCLFLTFFVCNSALGHDLVGLVKSVKPSVVGIGIYSPLGTPRNQLQGTGFAIADGTLIVTNHHVVESVLEDNQQRVVFIGEGATPETQPAILVTSDPAHDLAILKISRAIKPLTLASDQRIEDGSQIAFVGFPIGAVLGLYPATHNGYIAAYTPVVIPSINSSKLSIEMLKRLREPFYVYQLDATAYPGNSGSPLIDVKSGNVIGILNKVFIKQTKESALSDPSGISYAIPITYLRQLIDSR